LNNGASIIGDAQGAITAAIAKDYYSMGLDIGQFVKSLLFLPINLTLNDIAAYDFIQGFLGST